MIKPWSSVDALKTDCRWFRGDAPCRPHKEKKCHCTEADGSICAHYLPQSGNTLIIKLGAPGDVIRTTPLLRKLQETSPQRRVWWLTESTDLVPDVVDVVLPFTMQSLVTLQAVHFDLLINLDKSREGCALASTIRAGQKQGFTLVDGKPAAVNSHALPGYFAGIFDDLGKDHPRSRVEEIFAIAGFAFRGEDYILDNFARDGYTWKLPSRKPIIGLNTGCGNRWVSRLWPEPHWIALAKRLKHAGYVPLLLGGEREHKKNLRIAKRSGARYPGHFPLRQFVNLIDQCDLVVTSVTMAADIAIGLRKQLVLLNNTFNKHEFELYGRGVVLEPEYECTCYYSPVCPNDCMQYLRVDTVFDSVRDLLPT